MVSFTPPDLPEEDSEVSELTPEEEELLKQALETLKTYIETETEQFF
jgi:hypothetical protein